MKNKGNKEYKAVIDDGTREIPLVNKFGKLICKIYIRPADISILDRYEDLTKDFASLVEPLKKMELNADGTAAFEKDWQILKGVESELKNRINALFDMEEADDIFAKRNPFSSVGGKFFCESVIEVIGGVISEAVEDELKLSQERTAKYLDDIQSKPQIEVVKNAGTAPADS